ncbi:MAG: hypothetical protein F6K19_38780 [Cyanothece sp. SIO1E1]|nr:hypothetical protein [Cyanothece sp. SIO1E1]
MEYYDSSLNSATPQLPYKQSLYNSDLLGAHAYGLFPGVVIILRAIAA